MIRAWSFYRQSLTVITRRMAGDTRWKTWLALTPDGSDQPHGLPYGMNVLYQGAGDLGTRMNNAMVDMPPGPVIIIGTDIPGILPEDIATAFCVLGHTDTVFGPAQDGGYWLAGCRRRPQFPDLFSDVRWSTEHALADTLANTSRQNLSVHLLRMLEDVDDVASYERWRRNSRASTL